MKNDVINSPSHYISQNGIEAIQVIEAFNLNFNLGNVIKYALRSGKKENELQDLKKALWYLKREIESVEALENRLKGPIYKPAYNQNSVVPNGKKPSLSKLKSSDSKKVKEEQRTSLIETLKKKSQGIC
jgi:hypothetical protein